MSLKEEHYCHIYNRGINSGIVFKEPKDYERFFQSYVYYCYLTLDTYAYCLLNNHFHFLVRVRDTEEQKRLFLHHQQQNPETYHGLSYRTFKPQKAAIQCGHLFNSYTRSFNIRNDVTGPLFEGRFKRIEINDRQYRTQLVCYIHRNPIHHHLATHYKDYRWSSYHTFIHGGKDDFINCEKVRSWFGGTEEFIAAHEEMRCKLGPEFLLE